MLKTRKNIIYKAPLIKSFKFNGLRTDCHFVVSIPYNSESAESPEKLSAKEGLWFLPSKAQEGEQEQQRNLTKTIEDKKGGERSH